MTHPITTKTSSPRSSSRPQPVRSGTKRAAPHRVVGGSNSKPSLNSPGAGRGITPRAEVRSNPGPFGPSGLVNRGRGAGSLNSGRTGRNALQSSQSHQVEPRKVESNQDQPQSNSGSNPIRKESTHVEVNSLAGGNESDELYLNGKKLLNENGIPLTVKDYKATVGKGRGTFPYFNESSGQVEQVFVTNKGIHAVPPGPGSEWEPSPRLLSRVKEVSAEHVKFIRGEIDSLSKTIDSEKDNELRNKLVSQRNELSEELKATKYTWALQTNLKKSNQEIAAMKDKDTRLRLEDFKKTIITAAKKIVSQDPNKVWQFKIVNDPRSKTNSGSKVVPGQPSQSSSASDTQMNSNANANSASKIKLSEDPVTFVDNIKLPESPSNRVVLETSKTGMKVHGEGLSELTSRIEPKNDFTSNLSTHIDYLQRRVVEEQNRLSNLSGKEHKEAKELVEALQTDLNLSILARKLPELIEKETGLINEYSNDPRALSKWKKSFERRKRMIDLKGEISVANPAVGEDSLASIWNWELVKDIF